MAWGKQRMILASVLGLAVVALGVDRFVLSEGPAPAGDPNDLLVASKEAVTRVADVAGTLLGAEPKVQAVSKDAARVADLANTLRELGVDRSVLESLPESFAVALPKPVETAAAAVVVTPVGEPPAVSAVLLGKSPRALVGGKSLALGGAVDGWTLVHIAKGRAVFERDGQRVDRVVTRLPDSAVMVSSADGQPE